MGSSRAIWRGCRRGSAAATCVRAGAAAPSRTLRDCTQHVWALCLLLTGSRTLRLLSAGAPPPAPGSRERHTVRDGSQQRLPR